MDYISFPKYRTDQFKLDNGLTFIIREDKSNPVVSLQAWCETGSIHEGKYLGSGVSHFVEHMVFKGTEERESLAIAQDVSSIGGTINAYTSFDRTVYYINCPSEALFTSNQILKDLVFQATMPETEFEPEREVIRREISMGRDDADKVASQEMFSTCYQRHPYGLPVIGYLQSFNQLNRSDLRNYYKERYVTDNTFIVISGDVDMDVVRDQVNKLYGDIQRVASPPVFIPTEPDQLGRRDSFVPYSNPITRLWMSWKIPGITDSDMPAIDVIAVILGQGKSSRLFQTLKEQSGLVHNISAYSYTPSHAGVFAVNAGIDPNNKQKVEEEIYNVIQELKCESVSEEEINKAKRIAMVSQLSSLQTVQGQAADLGSNWSITRNVNFTEEYLRKISNLNADNIRDVANRYFKEESLSVIEVGKKIKLKKNKAEIFKNNKEINQHILDNGLIIAVEEDFRLPVVAISNTFKAGLFADSIHGQGITQLLSRVFLKGTNTKEADQIALMIESLGGNVTAIGGNNSLSLNSEFLSDDFEQALNIVSNIILHPTFPQPAVDREKETLLMDIKEERESPLSLAAIIARENLFDNHAYKNSRLGTENHVKALDTEKILKYYSNYGVANNGVISICGAIDSDKVIDKVGGAFSKMRIGDEVIANTKDAEWPVTQKEIEYNHHKEQAVLLVAYPGLKLDDKDRAIVSLIEEISGGMDGLLFKRIREELGLAYYVGTSQLVSYSRGSIYFYAGTNSESLSKVQHELEKIIGSLISEKIDDKVLERAKKSLIGKYSLSKQSYSARAQSMALNLLYGLGECYDEENLKLIKNTTSSDLQKCCQKYFNTLSKVTVRIVPNNK